MAVFVLFLAGGIGLPNEVLISLWGLNAIYMHYKM